MIKEGGPSRTAFNIFNYVFLVLLMFVTLYPMYYMFITSISNGLEVMKGEVVWLPKSLTFATYDTLFESSLFVYMKNTVIYTVLGTFINLVMSCMCAYPLSRGTFSGRKVLTALVTIPMFFTGGMIPLYLAVKQFGMLDSIWSLVLPGAISTYNMIIIRTSFQSLPNSLVESAQLDGANDIIILIRIIIPLSKAVLATMLLFYAVTHWNSYFDAMLYINTKSKYPMTIMLRNMLVGGLFSDETTVGSTAGSAANFAVTDSTMRAATIIVTALPILAVYPFVQRYFVKGVMIGSLKG